MEEVEEVKNIPDWRPNRWEWIKKQLMMSSNETYFKDIFELGAEAYMQAVVKMLEKRSGEADDTEKGILSTVINQLHGYKVWDY